ncbi:MAG: hypothetical protein PUP91_20545 [Rhizonema sp. PD37]|nr:hypothetical protein [Rhizonema sp. PD37]
MCSEVLENWYQSIILLYVMFTLSDRTLQLRRAVVPQMLRSSSGAIAFG